MYGKRRNRTVRMVAMVAAAVAMTAGTAAAEATPAVTATPSTDLEASQTVTVDITGFSPQTDVWISVCAADGAQWVCAVETATQVVTDASGVATTPLQVDRTYTGYDQTGAVWGPVDCATIPGGCLVAAGNPSGEQATAALTFRV